MHRIHFIAGVIGALTTMIVAFDANAFSISPVPNQSYNVTLVAGGCGLGFSRGSGFNHGVNSRFARSDHFNHLHHFRNRNRFAFFPGFVGGGWDWGYPYDYAAYGNGCWSWDGWQWINACYNYGGYNYGN